MYGWGELDGRLRDDRDRRNLPERAIGGNKRRELRDLGQVKIWIPPYALTSP